MDPEDLREVISAYQKCVAETVRRFGGFVAKYMGDGVLVYFGYPQAHEDDAERAVRAGLELIAAVAELEAAAPAANARRHCNRAGCGWRPDRLGGGAGAGIVGETPNLAARLQGGAEPNRSSSPTTREGLLGNLFECEDLGAKDLKGIAGPVRAWAVLRRELGRKVASRRCARPTTPLVGREEEIELLMRRWSSRRKLATVKSC